MNQRKGGLSVLAPVALAGMGCLALALAACEMDQLFVGSADKIEPDDKDFVESATPLAVPDFEMLWERAQQTLAGEGYAIDSDLTRYPEREIVSRWSALLAPSRFEGVRRRVWVRFRETRPGHWVVAVAAQKQRNADIDAPSDPAHAEWEPQPADEAKAAVLLWKIESGFRE